MIRLRAASWALLLAGLAVGTLSDIAPRRASVYLGGYRVLAADFHLHSFPLSASTLTPWDLIWDAQHQGLDAVAIAGHNEVWSGRVAHWFGRHFGGPTVLAAEEIHGPVYHMIAVGIHSSISWRLSAADAITEIHRQGGVALAAHPVAGAWPAYDARAMQLLDGSEVLQPVVFDSEKATSQLRAFYARKPMAAIASSDWHGLGPPGICRTWVFVHQDSEAEILRAIRDRRTVVYDRGQYFGDPALVALASADGRLSESPHRSPLALLSRVLAFLGLLGAAFACVPGVLLGSRRGSGIRHHVI